MSNTNEHKIVITAEMKEDSILEQNIELKGCKDFIITALSEIFLTLHEKNPEFFIMALGRAFDKIEESK